MNDFFDTFIDAIVALIAVVIVAGIVLIPSWMIVQIIRLFSAIF